MNKAISTLFLLLPLAGGCSDNVGGIWDPDGRGGGGGGGGGTTTESRIEAPRQGDLSRPGRPAVGVTAPLGTGWHITTPAVVIFTEALNRQSVYDGNLGVERLYVRDKTTTTKAPASVDVLGSGRVVVIRPTALLPEATYEIFLESGVKDLDGNAVTTTGVLGEFTTEPADSRRRPQVVAVYPPDSEDNLPREAKVLALLSVPVEANTVTTSSFYLRNESTAGTPAVVGTIDYPLDTVLGGGDSRVLRFVPTDPLPGGNSFGLVLKDTIRAAGLALDPGSTEPFSGFETLAWREADQVEVGALSLTAGFPNAINRNNLTTLRVDVGLPAGTLSGDRVEVRIYGGDPRTSAAGDLRYAEKSADAAGGIQILSVDFTGSLGALATPLLEDGEVVLAARITRSNVNGAWTVEDEAVQDTVAPTLISLGPPVAAGSTTDFLTDLQYCSLFGQASEAIGAAELVVTGVAGTGELFASDDRGWFFLKPLDLGLLTAPADLTLNLTDGAGNLNAAAVTGTLTQRGQIQGDLSGTGGDLTVEAWDLATLRAVAGARVVVESGVVTKPATNRLTATTGNDGQVTFPGLAPGRYTVTIVAAGYHLASLVNSRASRVSLPLEPMSGGTATLTGQVNFIPASGRFAYAGCNVPADRGLDGTIATLLSAPNTIPSTPILPNRPVLLTANVGVFPATTTSIAGIFGSPPAIIAGLTTSLGPPELGLGPGGSLAASIGTAPVTQVVYDAPYTRDLTGKGLDTNNLADGFPRVLDMGVFRGLPGWVPFGVGFTTGTPDNLSVNGNYAANLVSFLDLVPFLWSSLEARDTAGNRGRCRALFADYTLGTLIDPSLVGFPTIPTLTLAASATGTPQVQFADTLAPGGALTGLYRLEVTDGNGREWHLLVTDGDPAGGGETLQLPDLASSPATGLAIPSPWTMAVEAWLAVGVEESYCLEDFHRLHCTQARAAAKTIQVN